MLVKDKQQASGRHDRAQMFSEWVVGTESERCERRFRARLPSKTEKWKMRKWNCRQWWVIVMVVVVAPAPRRKWTYSFSIFIVLYMFYPFSIIQFLSLDMFYSLSWHFSTDFHVFLHSKSSSTCLVLAKEKCPAEKDRGAAVDSPPEPVVFQWRSRHVEWTYIIWYT